MSAPQENLHAGQPVLAAGTPLDQARAAVVLLHGRGGSAGDMLSLADELDCRDCAFLAPQAAHFTWYPYPFMSPIESNQPWLDWALERVGSLLASLEEKGIPAERAVLLGFSQGACLALEYAVRRARRYGGVIGFSGGLIGPPGTQWPAAGSLQETPVFLGCSDVDPHIPLARVQESERVLGERGAAVTARIYPGMEHTVNQDEVDFVRGLLERLAAS